MSFLSAASWRALEIEGVRPDVEEDSLVARTIDKLKQDAAPSVDRKAPLILQFAMQPLRRQTSRRPDTNSPILSARSLRRFRTPPAAPDFSMTGAWRHLPRFGGERRRPLERDPFPIGMSRRETRSPRAACPAISSRWSGSLLDLPAIVSSAKSLCAILPRDGGEGNRAQRGGGGVGRDPRNRHADDRVDGVVDGAHDLARRDAHDRYAPRPQPFVATKVALRPIAHVMADPVHLDGKPSLGALEIDHIGSQRMLTAKDRRPGRARPQPAPQPRFRRREVATQPSSVFDSHFRRSHGLSPLHRASRGPPPPLRRGGWLRGLRRFVAPPSHGRRNPPSISCLRCGEGRRGSGRESPALTADRDMARFVSCPQIPSVFQANPSTRGARVNHFARCLPKPTRRPLRTSPTVQRV